MAEKPESEFPAGTTLEYLIAILRIVIGWHFLYEGLTKLMYPGWTSAGYLMSSVGPLAGGFHWLGGHPGLVKLVDQLNMWGLVAVGLGLMLGIFSRAAAWGGIGALALYYLAYPPLFAPVFSGASEGHFLIVNRNLVELLALAVVAAFPATRFGLDGLLWHRRKIGVSGSPDAPAPSYRGSIPRRQLVAGLAGVPLLGVFVLAVLKKHGWRSFEEVQLRGRQGDTFVASATVKSFQFSSLSNLQGRLPKGRIGNVALSRMILGGNLIGGWAHARDLIYVSKLIKAYHTRDKVFETLATAEACGINAILTNPLLCDAINDYWREGGKIQFISDCGGKDVLRMTQRSIDHGACACYVQGEVADRLVQDGKFDEIAQVLDLTRKNGLPAGIGGHQLKTVQACVERGLLPDFWMKTLHRTDYWSAEVQPKHDNIWCEDPVETVAYMKQLKQPWIAFKTLAAGALEPKVGFRYAFESGADFICVGMYDFQIVDDVNLTLGILNGGLIREREWRA